MICFIFVFISGLYGRVSISSDGKNDPDSTYINAVYVDGFCLKNQFIATQLPLINTIKDFWKMIYEQGSTLIIVLNEINEEVGVSLNIL